jgi:hypothetical protein
VGDRISTRATKQRAAWREFKRINWALVPGQGADDVTGFSIKQPNRSLAADCEEAVGWIHRQTIDPASDSTLHWQRQTGFQTEAANISIEITSYERLIVRRNGDGAQLRCGNGKLLYEAGGR